MYRLVFVPQVEGDFNRLDKPIRQRVLDKVQWLLEHAHQLPHQPLSGKWTGTYKLRVGDYRVVYGLDHEKKMLIVYAVGHRREIYK